MALFGDCILNLMVVSSEGGGVFVVSDPFSVSGVPQFRLCFVGCVLSPAACVHDAPERVHRTPQPR